MQPLDNNACLVVVPRLLAEGGFLWKIPYHSTNTPQRRWFQIKPAAKSKANANVPDVLDLGSKAAEVGYKERLQATCDVYQPPPPNPPPVFNPPLSHNHRQPASARYVGSKPPTH